MGNSCCTSKTSTISQSEKGQGDIFDIVTLHSQGNLVFIVEEPSDIGKSAASIQKCARNQPQKLFLKNNVDACFKHPASKILVKVRETQQTEQSDTKTVYD